MVVAVATAAGCQGDDDQVQDPLATATDAGQWANRASALGIYAAFGYTPIAVADGQSNFTDPECPLVADDGITVTITGGCEASDGTHWLGTATVVRSGDDRTLSLDGYGSTSDLAFQSIRTGTVSIHSNGDGVHSFDVDATQSGIDESDVVYSGTVEGGYDGPSLWNGSGQVTYQGDSVEAKTTNQLVDGEVCKGQSASGTTTLTSNEHVVVITYDGAQDCDDEAAAQWSQDGIDQGLLEGVSCAVIQPSPASAAFVLFTLLGLLRLLARQRRRRNGSPRQVCP